MRRFSRRRRSGSPGEGRGAPIDAGRWLERISDEGIVPVCGLEVISHADIPESFAAVGRGRQESGGELIVSFAPRHAGDAVLAGLAAAGRLAEEEEFSGEVVAVAPQWSSSARRRLGLVRAELPFRLRALSASALADGNNLVEPEGALESAVLSISQIAAQLVNVADRELLQRAAVALDGLASKHGGCIRGVGRSVELVLLARRVAELRADERGVLLTTLLPQRSTTRLVAGELAVAFDDLEGQLRRRLNDRRLRDGEEGMRARVLPLLASALSLRSVTRWPLGGSDSDDLDLVGVDAGGQPVIGAARLFLGLPALGAILDAAQTLRLSFPTLLAPAGAPLRLEAPRIALASREFGSGALRALAGISLAHELFEIRSDREQGFELVSAGSEGAARSVRERPAGGRRRGGSRRGRGSDKQSREPQAEGEETEAKASLESAADVSAEDLVEAPGEASAESAVESVNGEIEANGAPRPAPRSRSRRRGRRRGRGRSTGDQESSGESTEGAGETAAGSHYEEVSLFDLDEGVRESDAEEGEEGRAGRGRRGRGRRRGRRPTVKEKEKGEEERGEEEEDEVAEDLTDVLAELPEDLSALDGTDDVTFPEDEPSDEDAQDDEHEILLELQQPPMASEAEVAVPAAAPKPTRRRAAVVAHADRDSLLAAVLLARDIRLLEGLWVYSQSELMNFFREVATDLREDAPIHLVGFTPSPAREVIQAAALYRDRLCWYDHHDWPPEDLVALHNAIGEEAVHQSRGVGSTLPVLLATCTRRSRFSDKLVDLATGRFTQHDYERWGRLWWWRLGNIAQKTGDVRSDIDPLLSGRPSDLAKEAATAETPPIPEEVEYITRRDFRLVHFAGYAMVIVDVEGDRDLHLAGRIARERYGASLSLAYQRGTALFLFGGEELSGRRTLDFGALSEHLVEKLDWVEALPDHDRVVRFRIRDLEAHPERLDEAIGEIAMGRSILER